MVCTKRIRICGRLRAVQVYLGESMADYIAINPTEYEPEAPLTSSLAARMVNNPVAIAEGAPGAPRVQAAALSQSLYSLIRASSALHVHTSGSRNINYVGKPTYDTYLVASSVENRNEWMGPCLSIPNSDGQQIGFGPNQNEKVEIYRGADVSFRNHTPTTLSIVIGMVIQHTSISNNRTAQIRLRHNGSVVQTINSSYTASPQTVTFSPISVSSGSYASWTIEARLDHTDKHILLLNTFAYINS